MGSFTSSLLLGKTSLPLLLLLSISSTLSSLPTGVVPLRETDDLDEGKFSMRGGREDGVWAIGRGEVVGARGRREVCAGFGMAMGWAIGVE